MKHRNRGYLFKLISSSLILLLGLQMLPIMLQAKASVVQGQIVTEDFESQTLGLLPTDPHYLATIGATGLFQTVNNFTLGNRSFQHRVTSGSGDITFATTSSDSFSICDPGRSFKFAFAINAFPTTGVVRFGIGNLQTVSQTVEAIWIELDRDGNAYQSMFSNAVITTFNITAANGPAIAVNEWVNVTMDFVSCSGVAKYRISVLERNFINSLAGPGVLGITFPSRFEIVQTLDSHFDMRVDNMVWGPIVSSFSSEAAVTFPSNNLKGFSMNTFGTFAIARNNATGSANPQATSNVTTYDTNLNVIGGPQETFCNRVDEVMSAKDNVIFNKCDSTTFLPTDFFIRSQALTVPSEGCDFCSYDVSITNPFGTNFFDEGGNSTKEIGEMASFPITFAGSGSQRKLAWAFSSITGRIGVDLFTNNQGLPDTRHTRSVQIGASTVDSLCAWTDISARSFIAGSRQGSSPQVLEVKFKTTSAGNLDADLVGVRIFTGTHTKAAAIACAQDRIAFALGTDPDTIEVFNLTSGTLQFPTIAAGGTIQFRGIALSNDGKWLAYYDGTNYHVVGANNGTEVAKFAKASSTSMVRLHMDSTAQNLWVAHQGAIARFVIFNTTTITPVSPGDPISLNPLPANGTVVGPPLQNAPAEFAAAVGISELAAKLFFGFLTIAICAVGTMQEAANRKFNPGTVATFGAVGAVLGFGVSYAFGYIPRAFVFVIIALITVIVAIRVVQARGD